MALSEKVVGSRKGAKFHLLFLCGLATLREAKANPINLL
jgi:hypothetical protein